MSRLVTIDVGLFVVLCLVFVLSLLIGQIWLDPSEVQVVEA